MTVSTVVATVQLAQLAFYVNRTINNGLTRARALEVMTQLGDRAKAGLESGLRI